MASAEPKGRERCCKAWNDLAANRRALWRWQALHQCSHSRVPISVATFAQLARVEDERAERLLRWAVEAGWMHYMGGLYGGRLAARR
jgi:hypothetical protein